MFDMKEHEFDESTFLGGWYMPEDICDNIINFWNENQHHTKKGTVSNNFGLKVDLERKDSWDIGIGRDYFEEPFKGYRIFLQQCLNNYRDRYPHVDMNSLYDIVEPYNVQGYAPGGGFKQWHCEVSNPNVMRRVLVFMTYLNDVPDGGTEFYHQKVTCPAKKGLTIIWPSHWTHSHRGQVSKEHNKLIVTGWFSYKGHLS